MLFSRKKVVKYLLGFFVFFCIRSNFNFYTVNAADRYFTNAVGGDFTNKTLWMTGVVPTAADNANFTNNANRTITWTIDTTNANVFINTTVSTMYTQSIASSTWSVTNQYIVGQNAGTVSKVWLDSGTLVVTNSAGTGALIVGQTGDGAFELEGGTVIVDHLYATNINKSFFDPDKGTLTILSDSIVSNTANSWTVGGVTSADSATVNILGGTFVLRNKAIRIGDTSKGTVNVVGSGTVWSNNAVTIGISADNSLLMISNSATVYLRGSNIVGASSSSDLNTEIITDGGMVFQLDANSGTFIGNNNSDTNSLIVTGQGSMLTNAGYLRIGSSGSFNKLIISNGAFVSDTTGNIGVGANSTNNFVHLTGLGSYWYNSAGLNVGSNATTLGSGSILIQDRAILEANTIENGINNSGNITNIGGIFQFTTADPTITTNAGSSIVLTNGSISYRNIANAPVLITNDLSKFSMFGSNTFMLNNATNAILKSYTFTNGFGGTNFAHLTLVNGASSWRATNTTIGATSQMLVSNTAGSTFGTITNAGTLVMAGDGTTLTNEGNLIIIGNGAGGAGNIVNLVGTNTISGPILLGGNSTIGTPLDQLTLQGTLTNNSFQLTVTNTGSTTLEIDSNIQGTGGLVHNGTGTLVLAGVNSAFSGVITNNVGGTIESASSTGLGTGNVVMNGGSINYTTANQKYDQTFTMNGAVTQNVAAGIEVALGTGNNDITGSGLIVKQGTGYLYLTNNTSQNNTGGWRIDDGRVIVNFAGNPLGTGTLTLNGGTLKQESASSTLINAISVTANSTLMFTNGSDMTWSSSTINATAGTTLTLDEESAVLHSGSLTFTGSNFTYAGNIDYSDSGLRIAFAPTAPSSTDPNGIAATNFFTGILSGLGETSVNAGAFQILTNIAVVLTRTNTYAGTTRIQHGTIIVESEAGLGTTAGATAITNNGTLAFLSNFTYSSAESIILSSTGGVRGVGLVGVGGTNRFAGYITNANDSSIGTWAGNLTLSGGLDMMGHSLVITNAANSVLTNSGIIVGSGPITHNGSGTVVFTGLNTFSGAVTNNGGTFEINSPTGLGVTTSVVLNGGTLLFKGSLTNTSAAVTLNGGIISESDTNVSLGAMTISANSTVSLGSGGAAGRLTFASGTNIVGSGAKLTIYGWSWNSGLSGGSDDLIFFTSTSFETASFLNNVTFFGTGGGARVLSSGELVPITPEPTTITSALILLGLLSKRLFSSKKFDPTSL